MTVLRSMIVLNLTAGRGLQPRPERLDKSLNHDHPSNVTNGVNTPSG